jgi:hypothetical protein
MSIYVYVIPERITEEGEHLELRCSGGPVEVEEVQEGLEAVFRIHDIFVWIRIRGSMTLTNGSGSGSLIRILLFMSLTFKMPAKN